MHQELADQAVLYVLGALTGGDTSAFEAHLIVCAECATEVRRFAPVLEALAAAAPEATPESKVRRGLLARLNAESSM